MSISSGADFLRTPTCYVESVGHKIPSLVIASGILFDLVVESAPAEDLIAPDDLSSNLILHWELKENPTRSIKNLRVDNVDDVAAEFRRITGPETNCVIDLTSSKSRNIAGLQALSKKLDRTVDFVFSTSPNDHCMSMEAVAQLMKSELLVGCEITPGEYVRAGVIYCQLGTHFQASSDELSTVDRNMLVSCATVHNALKELTQVGRLPLLIVSAGPFAKNHSEIIALLADHGADLSRVLLNQLVIGLREIDYYKRLLDQANISVCFDSFGHSTCFSPRSGPCYNTDSDAIAAVIELCQRGYTSRIILSTNIKTKLQLRRYGGPGLSILVDSVIPRLMAATQDTDTPSTLKVENVHELVSGNLFSLLAWYRIPTPTEIQQEMMTCYICNESFVPGSHYSKFSFVYCSSACLSSHRTLSWAIKPP